MVNIQKYLDDNDSDCIISSSVPQVCTTENCIVGIDEAGRGPVLGPMVYGIAYCPLSQKETLRTLGVDDSKALKEEERKSICDKLEGNSIDFGYSIHILSPHYISTSMYKREKYNLNNISHDSAIGLLQTILKSGVKVTEVYVDTVGPPEKYEAKLSNLFPNIIIKVSKKADSLFPIVSAASIIAKVSRDLALKNWDFGQISVRGETGSGYPGDPITKEFLRHNLHPLFGFPNLVRFSWKTAEKIMNEEGYPVVFEDIEPIEEKTNHPSVKNYFSFAKKPNNLNNLKNHHFFWTHRGLSSMTFI